jgi:hypothetical protein
VLLASGLPNVDGSAKGLLQGQLATPVGSIVMRGVRSIIRGLRRVCFSAQLLVGQVKQTATSRTHSALRLMTFTCPPQQHYAHEKAVQEKTLPDRDLFLERGSRGSWLFPSSQRFVVRDFRGSGLLGLSRISPVHARRTTHDVPRFPRQCGSHRRWTAPLGL